MDPNMTLDALRELVLQAREDKYAPEEIAEQFADLFNALDEWLTRGGFLPADWNRS